MDGGLLTGVVVPTWETGRITVRMRFLATWAELSDANPAFPNEVPFLKAGDELEVNWGNQPCDDPETRVVDFVIEHRDWWTLHAWAHFDNPEGVFTPFNHNEEWDPLDAPPHH